MILIRVTGGLGNQLFQYAFARAIEKKTKRRVFLCDDTSSSFNRKILLNRFSISLPIKSRKEWTKMMAEEKSILRKFLNANKPSTKKMIVITEDSYQRYEAKSYLEHLDDGYNYYFFGHWQSVIIAEMVHKELLQEIQPISPLSLETRSQLEHINDSSCPVAVHIRLKWQKGNDGYISTTKHGQESLPLDYYHRSIQLMKEKLIKPTFFIFADDISAAKKILFPLRRKIKADYVFMAHGDRQAWEDLELIRHCRHFILSNSTFCWWASWLASRRNPQSKQGKIIMPVNWLAFNPGVIKSKRLKITQETLLL